MPQHPFAMAATQRVEETVPTICTHDDEIGIGLAGHFQDSFDHSARVGLLPPLPTRYLGRRNRWHGPLVPDVQQREQACGALKLLHQMSRRRDGQLRIRLGRDRDDDIPE